MGRFSLSLTTAFQPSPFPCSILEFSIRCCLLVFPGFRLQRGHFPALLKFFNNAVPSRRPHSSRAQAVVWRASSVCSPGRSAHIEVMSISPASGR